MLLTGSETIDTSVSPVWHICTDGPLLIARVEPNPNPAELDRDRVVAWPVELKDAETTPARLIAIVRAHHEHIAYDEPPAKWDILFDRATTVPPFLLTMPVAAADIHEADCYGLLSTEAPAIWFPLSGEGNTSSPFDIGKGPRNTFGQTIRPEVQADIARRAAAWLDTLA
jgi:hypothetical protein